MKPVGLVYKKLRINSYTGRASGELKVVHLCLGCNKVSTNRIAGDDNCSAIIKLLRKPNENSESIRSKLKSISRHLLTEENKEDVLIALFGYEYKRFIKKRYSQPR
jgi:hypothetical protein